MELATLQEVFEHWYGKLYHSHAGTQKRCLLLGAGISISIDADAPLFQHISRAAKEQNIDIFSFHDSRYEAEPDPGQLFEAITMLRGKRRVAEAILSEPHREWMLARPAVRLGANRPSTGYGFFRTLKEYTKLAARQRSDLPVMNVRRGAIVLGRLVTEEIFDQILTLNWDAVAELGVFLAGIRVEDEDDHKIILDQVPDPGIRSARVFEGAADVESAPPRGSSSASIYKLHGGIRRLHSVLCKPKEEMEAVTKAEQEFDKKVESQLKTDFLVSTSDLQQWSERSQWVQDTVNSSLRYRAALYVGISFADPCVYQTARRRITAWQEGIRDSSLQKDKPDAPDLPPSLSIDFGAGLIARNAMTVSQSAVDGFPKDVDRCALYKSDAILALQKILGLHYLHLLLRAYRTHGGGNQSVENSQSIKNFLRNTIEEIASGNQAVDDHNQILDVLLHCLVPGSRWAAIAESRPPFNCFHPCSYDPILDPPVADIHQKCWSGAPTGYHKSHAAWWQSRWRHDCDNVDRCDDCQQLRAIATFIYCMREENNPFSFSADIQSEALVFTKKHQTYRRQKALLWPWPWHWKKGLNSNRLTHAVQAIAPDRAPAPHLQGTSATAVLVISNPDSGFINNWQLNKPWDQRPVKKILFDGQLLKVYFLKDIVDSETNFFKAQLFSSYNNGR